MTNNTPEYGKVYDLLGIASGKSWSESEVKPETAEEKQAREARQKANIIERAERQKTEDNIIKNLFPNYNPNKNTVDIGDIFYDSWGYDQTNIDFYQVFSVSPSGKSARVRKIASRNLGEDGFMSNKVIPEPGKIIESLSFQPGEKSNLRINKPAWANGEIYLGSGRHSLSRWEGNAMTESHYA